MLTDLPKSEIEICRPFEEQPLIIGRISVENFSMTNALFRLNFVGA